MLIQKQILVKLFKNEKSDETGTIEHGIVGCSPRRDGRIFRDLERSSMLQTMAASADGEELGGAVVYDAWSRDW